MSVYFYSSMWIPFRHFTEVYIHSLYSCPLFRLLVPSVWSQQTYRIPYDGVRTCWSSHSAGVGTHEYLRYICRFRGEKASQPDREVTIVVNHSTIWQIWHLQKWNEEYRELWRFHLLRSSYGFISAGFVRKNAAYKLHITTEATPSTLPPLSCFFFLVEL